MLPPDAENFSVWGFTFQHHLKRCHKYKIDANFLTFCKKYHQFVCILIIKKVFIFISVIKKYLIILLQMTVCFCENNLHRSLK